MNPVLKEKIFKALHERNGIQRYVARNFLFNLLQRLGLHLTGDHFYEIVPNTHEVAKSYCTAARSLPGIDWRMEECETRLLRLIETYGAEYFTAVGQFGFEESNYYFRGLDALTLYLMLRDLKPKKFVEIGQGRSTQVALAALEMNARETNTRPVFVSADPYPRFRPADFPRSIDLQLIEKEVQSLDIESVLRDCRFLFVDSSHVYKFGSDVAFEFTTIYPRLAPGTILHLHDIFSPFDYPLDWIVKQKRFWNEQYFLESFLMFNSAFEVYLPVYLLGQQSTKLSEGVRRLSPDEKFKHRGYSFYLKRSEQASTSGKAA